jgi:hypothetical protein
VCGRACARSKPQSDSRLWITLTQSPRSSNHHQHIRQGIVSNLCHNWVVPYAIFALVSGRRRPEDIRKAYRILQAIFGKAS